MATIKTIFDSDIRRFHVPQPRLQEGTGWQFVLQNIRRHYGEDIQVQYKDDEDDTCLITSEDELLEALRLTEHVKGQGRPLRLLLTKRASDGDVQPSDPSDGKHGTAAGAAVGASVPAELSQSPQQQPEEEDGVLVEVPDSPAASAEAVGSPLRVEDTKEAAPVEAEEPQAAADPPVEADAQPPTEAPPAAQEEEAKGTPTAVHEGVFCDLCGMSPITGHRYKCTVCTDFDLCGTCQGRGLHFPHHALVQAKLPLQDSEMEKLCGPPASPKATFVDDVTIPDGTPLPPDVNITKTWSLKNSGKGIWPRSTRLVFVSGDLPPDSSQDNPAVPTANPGDVVEVSAILKMPSKPGRYTGYYRLAHGPQNTKFGHRVWVDVVVSPASTSLAPAGSSQAAPQPVEEEKGVIGQMRDAFTSNFNRVAARLQGQGEKSVDPAEPVEHASVLLGQKMVKCPGCTKAVTPPVDKAMFACETCSTLIHVQPAQPAAAPQEKKGKAQPPAAARDQDFDQDLQLALQMSKEEAKAAKQRQEQSQEPLEPQQESGREEAKGSATVVEQAAGAAAEGGAEAQAEAEPVRFAAEIRQIREFGFDKAQVDDEALSDLLQAAKGSVQTVTNWLLASSK